MHFVTYVLAHWFISFLSKTISQEYRRPLRQSKRLSKAKIPLTHWNCQQEWWLQMIFWCICSESAMRLLILQTENENEHNSQCLLLLLLLLHSNMSSIRPLVLVALIPFWMAVGHFRECVQCAHCKMNSHCIEHHKKRINYETYVIPNKTNSHCSKSQFILSLISSASPSMLHAV